MFDRLGSLLDVRPSTLTVPDAVTQVVIGQMLSQEVARDIA